MQRKAAQTSGVFMPIASVQDCNFANQFGYGVRRKASILPASPEVS